MQALEGLVLGSTTVHAGLSTRASLLLAAAFAATAPAGIAAGVAVRASLDANAPALVLATGVLEAVAAGTVIFLALGDHMNATRAHAAWLRAQAPAARAACFAAFFVGAAAMLVIGIWA
jgi:zinc transporter 1/2/3